MRAALVDLIAALLAVGAAWRVMLEALRRQKASRSAKPGATEVDGMSNDRARPQESDADT